MNSIERQKFMESIKIPGRTRIYLPKTRKTIPMNSNLGVYLSRKLGIKKRRRMTKKGIINSGPEVFYDVYQGTEIYTEGTLNLVNQLGAGLERSSYDEYEFSGLGNLLSDNSFFSSPLNIPTLDNREYREAIGLTNSISDDLKRYCQDFNEIIAPFCVRSPIRIKKKSHSGFPFFQYDKEKAFLVYYGLENSEIIMKAFRNHDLSLLQKLYLLPLFTQNERLTPMKHEARFENGRIVSKPAKKKVINSDYVLWQSKILKEKPEILKDMDFSIKDPDCMGKYASHGRVVLGMNISLNCFAQIVDGMIQNGLKSLNCCKMDHPENLYKEFDLKQCKYFLSWDYSSYDASNNFLILEHLFDGLLPKLISEDWIYMLKCLRGSPVLYYSLERGENRPILVGDFFNSSLLSGETSGFGMVASDGKYPSTIVTSFLLQQFSHEPMDVCLNNGNPLFHFKVMGDNAIFGFRNRSTRDRFRDFVNKQLVQKRVPFTLKFDKIANFGGYFWPDGKSLVIDASKFLESVIYSERDVSNKPFFAAGFYDKLTRFMDSNNSTKHLVYKNLKDTLKGWGHDISDMESTNPPKIKDSVYYTENPMIQEILDNPDKLIYKYNIENFDPRLVDQFFTTVPVDWYSNYI